MVSKRFNAKAPFDYAQDKQRRQGRYYQDSSCPGGFVVMSLRDKGLKW